MSLSAAAIRMLVSKGFTASDIADLAEANEAMDSAAERRRAYDRERKRRAKDGNSGGIPVERQEAFSGGIPVEIPAEPRARVEDITSRLEITGSTQHHVNADETCEISNPPTRPELERLESLLREAGGPALDAAAPKLLVLAPILSLMRQGQGPACDLSSDILPTVRARCSRAPPGSIRSWDYFSRAISDARDRRLAGAPTANERPDHNRPSARDGRLDRMLAGAARAVGPEPRLHPGDRGDRAA